MDNKLLPCKEHGLFPMISNGGFFCPLCAAENGHEPIRKEIEAWNFWNTRNGEKA